MFPCGGPVEGVATRKTRLGPYTTSEGLAVAVFEELRDVGPDYLAHVEGGELLVVPVPSQQVDVERGGRFEGLLLAPFPLIGGE